MSPPSLTDTHSNLSAATAPVALSYELFPPRSPKAAETLWTTIRELEATDPDYVSVTYGASGSNRDTAVDLINRLLLETTLRPCWPTSLPNFLTTAFAESSRCGGTCPRTARFRPAVR